MADLRFFIIAGEPSGDQLGAALMNALKRQHEGDVSFEGEKYALCEVNTDADELRLFLTDPGRGAPFGSFDNVEKQATSVGLCWKSFNNKANNRSTICTIRSNSQSETSILKREYSDEARTDNNTTTQKATYAEMVKNGKKKQPNFELKHFKNK